jgi:hypothetical protein
MLSYAWYLLLQQIGLHEFYNWKKLKMPEAAAAKIFTRHSVRRVYLPPKYYASSVNQKIRLISVISD